MTYKNVRNEPMTKDVIKETFEIPKELEQKKIEIQ